jgi:serine/threonine protein kinase
MSDRPPQGIDTWIDAIATPFERAWRAGRRPRIEDYLAGVEEPRRSLLFEELLRTELQLRRKAGEAPGPEDYQSRFPEHSQMIRELFADAAPSPSQPLVMDGGHGGVDDPSPFAGPVIATRPYHPGAIEGAHDATLSYSVARRDGEVVPLLLSPQDLERLANTFFPGMVLQGRYILERELGRGAMGLVFLGRDNRPDRPVAVKVILPGDSGGGARGPATEKQLQDRFLQEAKIGANLTHPAIATVHDFGYHGEAPFTIFEYVAGPTLQEVLRHRGRIPLEEVRLIIGPLAQALDFAHSRFVVHRDLKPANIKASEQGDFKILDLGLATEFRRQADWAFCGTPAYASPEQASGLPADGRSDQYALALITFEMLTGRRVFESTSIRELLKMQRAHEPPSARSLMSTLNESIDDAIRRALSKDPAKRYANCLQFAAAIGCQFLSGSGQLPVILLEAEIKLPIGLIPKSLTPSWVEPLTDTTFSLDRLLRPWLGQSLHLILTRDSLWGLHGFEAVRIPLRDVNARTWFFSNDSTLRVVTNQANGWRWKSLEFPSRHGCRVWKETLQWACKNLPPSREPPAGSVPVEQIVLVTRQPPGRYLLLGQVEAQGHEREAVRSGMLLRARMAGADAVVDYQEEQVFGPMRNTWRSAGSAIRAVDSEGRWQLKSRWFGSEIRRRALICIVALVSLSLVSMSHWRSWLGAAVAFLLPVLLWVALRQVQWAELIRPTALAILFLGAGNAAVFLDGLFSAVFAPGPMAYYPLSNPFLWLQILLRMSSECAICLFACRYLWGLRTDYRSLLLDSDNRPSRVRTAIGLSADAMVAVYLLLLVVIVGFR